MIVLADAFASTSYNIVLFLHILSAVVAFAPGFVNPVLGALSRQSAPQIAGPRERDAGPAHVARQLVGDLPPLLG